MINAAGIRHLCHYHGVADPQLKADLLAKADLFLFPTRYANEAQPLVVLEAMAAGVGIITTDIGTLSEIIRKGETGWICTSDTPDDLAALICEAISTPEETRKFATNARQECRLRFSQARFAQNLQTLITVTVSQRRERP
jgi:glycosyltransferase involved in cell wall biosynthesis